MKMQTVRFAIERKNNVVKKVGRSFILQLKVNFKGGKVKWYEDKPKKGN